jgi:cardiolipin synthase
MKLTVPNCLTLFRLLLVPVVAVVFLSGNAAAALILFAVAGATDLLDGYIARKTNTATRFG